MPNPSNAHPTSFDWPVPESSVVEHALRHVVVVVRARHLRVAVAIVLHLVRDRVAPAGVDRSEEQHARLQDPDLTATARRRVCELRVRGDLELEVLVLDRVRVAVALVGVVARVDREHARRVVDRQVLRRDDALGPDPLHRELGVGPLDVAVDARLLRAVPRAVAVQPRQVALRARRLRVEAGLARPVAADGGLGRGLPDRQTRLVDAARVVLVRGGRHGRARPPSRTRAAGRSGCVACRCSSLARRVLGDARPRAS